jgi:helix-turn-helix protein
VNRAGAADRDGGKQQAEPAADSFAAELGRRLRAARAVAGLSLAQVQRQSGGRWTGGAIGTYERGSRNITAENLVALAGFYGIDPVALIPGAAQSRGEGRPAPGERDSGAGPSPAVTSGPPAGEGGACFPRAPRGGSQPTPWEPPRPPQHAARARLTGAQRATLAQAAASLERCDPDLAAGARTLAGTLRSALPGLGELEIAAVLAVTSTTLSRTAELSYPHLSDAAGLLAAVTLDLAHLEVT